MALEEIKYHDDCTSAAADARVKQWIQSALNAMVRLVRQQAAVANVRARVTSPDAERYIDAQIKQAVLGVEEDASPRATEGADRIMKFFKVQCSQHMPNGLRPCSEPLDPADEYYVNHLHVKLVNCPSASRVTDEVILETRHTTSTEGNTPFR